MAVVEPVPGDRRIVMNNTYTLGGSTAQFNQERQAHLPILLHGDVHTIATLGVATGSTLAGATLHPSIQRIDAIELSPLVADLAQKHFAPYNRDAFNHQNVRLILEDARWIMAQSKSTYDLVLGDLFLPWESGAGRLFTLEHFQNIHQALKPGGLFCQWLPMFQLTSDQFESILHTFQSVFPDTLLVRGDFYAELPILGLIGGLTPERIRWDLLSQQCSELRIRNQIQDPLVRHPEGIALLIVGTPAPTSNAVPPLNTLANGWLEFDAARNILGLKTPWFAGVPFASFIRHSQQLNRDFIPDSLRPMHESGQFFLTLEIAGAIQSKELATLQAQAPNRLPYVMRADPHAQWTSWPSAYFSPKPLKP